MRARLSPLQQPYVLGRVDRPVSRAIRSFSATPIITERVTREKDDRRVKFADAFVAAGVRSFFPFRQGRHYNCKATAMRQQHCFGYVPTVVSGEPCQCQRKDDATTDDSSFLRRGMNCATLTDFSFSFRGFARRGGDTDGKCPDFASLLRTICSNSSSALTRIIEPFSSLARMGSMFLRRPRIEIF